MWLTTVPVNSTKREMHQSVSISIYGEKFWSNRDEQIKQIIQEYFNASVEQNNHAWFLLHPDVLLFPDKCYVMLYLFGTVFSGFQMRYLKREVGLSNPE